MVCNYRRAERIKEDAANYDVVSQKRCVAYLDLDFRGEKSAHASEAWGGGGWRKGASQLRGRSRPPHKLLPCWTWRSATSTTKRDFAPQVLTRSECSRLTSASSALESLQNSARCLLLRFSVKVRLKRLFRPRRMPID